MKAIKLTAKRQATLPKALCDELNLKPGDTIYLDQRKFGNKQLWCIVPAPEEEIPSWYGVFHKYAKGKSNRMEDIRKSIVKHFGDDDAE
jgi:bifunctional DNA-binding transcriptional regulator/antitoxin component of YhaV-PrlF toxin-antitoxin module